MVYCSLITDLIILILALIRLGFSNGLKRFNFTPSERTTTFYYKAFNSIRRVPRSVWEVGCNIRYLSKMWLNPKGNTV